jgi:hypothetical protein
MSVNRTGARETSNETVGSIIGTFASIGNSTQRLIFLTLNLKI